MRNLHTAIAFVVALLVAGGVAAPVTAVQAAPNRAGTTYVLVVSPKLDLRDISMAEVRRVFGGNQTYAGGTRLVPFNYAAGDRVRAAFDRIALDMSPNEVARYWVDRRIRGQGQAPRTVPNPSFMVAVAERLVGAIGYVPSSALPSGKIRALTVDGVAHDQPGYPLRGEH